MTSPTGIPDENLAAHQTYLDGLVRGELRFQRCGACRGAVFYPRVLCNLCGSTDLRFEVSAGFGTVYANTAVAESDAPSYSVCLVDLDEGFRMMSTVVDVPAEEVAIGQRVAASFEPVDDVGQFEQEVRVVFSPVTS